MTNRCVGARPHHACAFGAWRAVGASAAAVLAGACALLMTALPASAQIMRMQGEHKVTNAGAFEYVVPIAVGPGVAGKVPAVSLVFNSASGNGTVGVGWNLNAGSSIQYCPKTLAQDGERGPQTYGADARFCLDGQKLMLVSGTYGQPGSEYRTEMESFRRIRYYAPSGAVSSYFVVEEPDGDRIEYGGTTDTSIALDGVQPVLVAQWWRRKESDALGNAITYSYERDSATRGLGAVYLRKIAYGGNAAKGLADSAWVNFDYEDRPDRHAGYRAGYEMVMQRRLKSIQTVSGSSVLHNYTLVYETGPTSARSRLKRITQCAADGACLPPTVMDFEAEDASLGRFYGIDKYFPDGSLHQQAAAELGVSKVFLGDVNGDGKTDLIEMPAGGLVYTWIADASEPFGFKVVRYQFTPVRNQWLMPDTQWPVMTGDFNGDGRTDVFRQLPNKIGVNGATYPTEWLIYLSKGDGTYEIVSYMPGTGWAPQTGISLLDLDGDGRTDVISADGSVNPPVRNAHLSQGSGVFNKTVLPASNDTGLVAFEPAYLDANGDGVTDYLSVSLDGTTMRTFFGKGNGVFEPSAPTTIAGGAPEGWQVGDFNGDGIADVVLRTQSYPDRFGGVQVTLRPYFGRGDGTFAPGPVTTKTLPFVMAQALNWMAADANGDGRLDLITIGRNSYDDGGGIMDRGGMQIWIAQPDGSFNPIGADQALNDLVQGEVAFFPMDDLGRGSPDLVALQSLGRSTWRFSPLKTDLPSAISTAPRSSVTWKSMTLSQAKGVSYLQDKQNAAPGESTGYQWPKVTAAPATPVVTETVELGGSVMLTTRYTYGTLLFDKAIDGRGSAGFAWTQNDVQTIRSGESFPTQTSRQVFSQDFPFIGMTVKQGSGRNGRWDEFLQTDVSYDCLSPNEPVGSGMTACSSSPQPGRRFHTYTKSTRTKNFDPSGALLGDKLSEVLSLDAYGNVLSSKESLFAAGASTARYVSTTDNAYSNDIAKWQLRKLVQSKVTRSNGSAGDVPGGSGTSPGDGGGGQAPINPAALQAILMLLLED